VGPIARARVRLRGTRGHSLLHHQYAEWLGTRGRCGRGLEARAALTTTRAMSCAAQRGHGVLRRRAVRIINCDPAKTAESRNRQAWDDALNDVGWLDGGLPYLTDRKSCQG